MAKFYGVIGFGTQVEISPGVWDYAIVEKPYFGDVIRDTLESVGGDKVLSDRKTTNAFRIIADPYAEERFSDMKYVTWHGKYWEIRQVELHNRPRMTIRIGGIYEGPLGASDDSGNDPGDP